MIPITLLEVTELAAGWSVVELEVEEVDPLLVVEIRLWKDSLYPVRLLYMLMNYTILSQSHMTTTIQREIQVSAIIIKNDTQLTQELCTG